VENLMEADVALSGAAPRLDRIDTLKYRRRALLRRSRAHKYKRGGFVPTIELECLGEVKGQESSGSVRRSPVGQSVGCPVGAKLWSQGLRRL
jgi:hypothetical protein